MMNPFEWLRRGGRLDELSEEIQSHIDEKTDELIALGHSHAEAEREARRAFGNVTRVKEAAGDVWHFESVLADVASDVRHALRGLIHKPGFALAVILTLALGIGANAVVFALVNAVVLRPLPYPDSDRLISLSGLNFQGHDSRELGAVIYEDWRQLTTSIESSAAYGEGEHVIQTAGAAERMNGVSAQPAYFGIFGVQPLIGRTFDESETSPGGGQVIVLSEPLWRERFGADPAILGRTMMIDGKARSIIGVLPAAFTAGREERFWIPLFVPKADRDPNADWVAYSVLARMKAGVSLDAIRAELNAVTARQPRGRANPQMIVMTLHERRQGETRRPLLILFGAVGVLLLTACANIANLALARAARREQEFALRLALGASRWRIVRFVLIENLALAVGGALIGLLLVRASLGWFVHVSPGSIQNSQTIGVNAALILYTSLLAIVTSLFFGMMPALTASRASPNQTLASGSQHAAGSRRDSFARRALVIGELAIALVFLTGAGLVGKTFWQVTRVDPGIHADHVLIAHMELGDRYTNANAETFWANLIARVRQYPATRSAAWVQGAPMTRSGIGVAGRIRGQAGKPPMRYRPASVDPEYFETVGARLIAGRLLTAEDRKGAPPVAVVSEGFSTTWFDGAPAVGRTIRDYKCRRNNDCDPFDITIVGVLKEMVQEAYDGQQYPLVFIPMAQRDRLGNYGSLLVRTSGELAPLEALIRAEVRALDPQQPEPKFFSMERAMEERIAPRKFTLVLLVSFAALAVGLAIIGLYSVLAYLVAERTREIGIRIAIGAAPGRVTAMVLGQGLKLTIIGLGLGAAASIGAVRVLRAWMYEMSVYDAPTFVAVAVLLCLVALGASWLPARRASRVDPVLALRAD